MKKLAILFLLTTLLVSFSFAQVSIVGGFEAGNVAGGNSGDMDPALFTEFYGAASQQLGPGTIGVELGLGTKLHLSKDGVPATAATAYDFAGDNYLKGSYTLAVGPGSLAFALSTWGESNGGKANFGDLHIGADYDGLAVGPATLGFGAEYQFKTTGIDGFDKKVFADKPKVADVVQVRVSAAIAAFSIIYKFNYALDPTSEISRIAYVDASYKINDPLTVGLELDDTGKEFKAFTLKPYVNYSLSDSTIAGAYVKVQNINNDVTGSKDILFSPGVTIKHIF
ncbi:MAG: hypothetical protein LBI67_08920 [Treponema sp.]|jgi:hypothetical protein|nr:hypothetical protein [Treponema sp.]